jgi:hypothetical protein
LGVVVSRIVGYFTSRALGYLNKVTGVAARKLELAAFEHGGARVACVTLHADYLGWGGGRLKQEARCEESGKEPMHGGGMRVDL